MTASRQDLEEFVDLVAQVVREELAGAVPRFALSIPEAARALAIGRTTAYEMVKSGELPSFTIRGRKVVPVAALEAWVAAQTPSSTTTSNAEVAA